MEKDAASPCARLREVSRIGTPERTVEDDLRAVAIE